MDNKRIIQFSILSFLLLMFWQTWMRKDAPPAPAPAAPAAATAAAPANDVKLETGRTISVTTDTVRAEIDTAGGDLRRLALLTHGQQGNAAQPFELLQPAPHVEVVQTGLLGALLPNHHAVYQAQATQYALQPGQDHVDVHLTWQDPHGVNVDKVYTFHKGSYLVDVSYTITNKGATPLAPTAYFQILRDDAKPEGEARFINAYHGAAVYTDAAKYEKVSFSDVEKGKAAYPHTARDGWIGMVQHYFVSAFLPPNGMTRDYYVDAVSDKLFRAGFRTDLGTINPGQSKTLTVPFYAGPQEQKKLAAIAPGLERTVDYGKLTIICVPIFWLLSQIHALVSNWGLTIILLTLLIKAAFYPLASTSYRSMARMKKLAPKLQRLKEQYGDDRMKLNQAMMELYKAEKVNPVGGCLPMVVQIPVFIALYWVLLGSVEMRQAHFLWINDLSAADPYYILPVIMGVTMFLQTKLNPAPVDPMQAKMMMLMPLIFTAFFFFSPAGLVVYWTMNNLLSIAQQWYITRSLESASK